MGFAMKNARVHSAAWLRLRLRCALNFDGHLELFDGCCRDRERHLLLTAGHGEGDEDSALHDDEDENEDDWAQ
ncbi:hypothetical protein B0H19DRAFT_1137690 [Mycena capillaripes]|nr:hypothetical protein B0H19DRAFT_1137690 [Mycena capillaripes]